MFNKFIIYKNNLINNIKQVKKENPNSMICAMVKANAYGVGDIEVVKTLNEYADFFGVACFFEAKRIKTHTSKPILILGSVEKQEIDESFRYSCVDIEDLKFLISLNKPIKIHLKINSGMNRYGFKDVKQFKKALNMISQSKLILEGVFTHFATTDDYVNIQMKNFKSFLKVCKNFNVKPIVHADNSFVNEKFNHGLDMVRVGFSLFNRNDGWFLPVVEIKSQIVQVYNVAKGELVGYDYRCVATKNIKIGVVPIGYADGFDLKLIGIGLLINNVECKVLNISMDCFILDITNTDIKKGDEICILNKFNSLNHYA
ncbi:MAG: alanine racemase [Clostridia bacterium]|nr:alanine racemase [Clostridia bacterium]